MKQGILYAAIIGLVAGAIGAWYISNLRIASIESSHRLILSEMERESALAIAAANAARADAESRLQDRQNEITQTYDRHLADIARRLGTIDFRLRDPGQANGDASSGDSRTTTGTCVHDRSDPGAGELSESATRFLLAEAERADVITERLRACIESDTSMRSVISDYNRRIRIIAD